MLDNLSSNNICCLLHLSDHQDFVSKLDIYELTVAALWLATIPPLKKKYKKKSLRIHFLTVYSTYIEVSGTYFIFSFDPRLNDL